MNTVLLALITIPVIEIYLFIKIGSKIGALSTILLIFFTAILGVFYARYEGLNTIRSGLTQLIKNQIPAYEMISGAAIAFSALLLIIPGFATDFFGFLILIPFFLEFLSVSFPVHKLDSFHEGQKLSSAYKSSLDGSLWSGSFVTIGIFFETISNRPRL